MISLEENLSNLYGFDEYRHLYLLGKDVFVHVGGTFLDYRVSNRDEAAVEWNTSQLAVLDVWISTVVKCSTRRQRKGAHLQQI